MSHAVFYSLWYKLTLAADYSFLWQLASGIRVNETFSNAEERELMRTLLYSGKRHPFYLTSRISDPPIHPYRLSQWPQTLRSRTKMWNWNWWWQGTELPRGNTSCPLAYLHLPASHLSLSLHTSTTPLVLFKGNTANTSAVSDGAAQKRVCC